MSQVRDVLSRLLLAAAEHLKALLRSSVTGQVQEEGGSSRVGAGISPPWEPLREPLTGTLLPQPLLCSHSMHYVNCLHC